jgi:hypothetical protein
MPFGRISSKLPASHPAFCPTLSITDTNTHSIASVASGTSPAYMSLPASAVDVDGRRFSIGVAGRITLYDGATQPTFNLHFRQGNPTANTLWSLGTLLRPSQTGEKIPFRLGVECYYDAVAKQICGFGRGYIGTYQAVTSTNGAFWLVNAVVSPNDLTFSVDMDFTVAPLSGTTVQILEFGLA